MLADFHSTGIIPVLYVSRNMMANGLHKLLEQYFRTHPWIPSGPGALFILTLSKNCFTLVQLKSISNKSSFGNEKMSLAF